jgi:hypothetical protein
MCISSVILFCKYGKQMETIFCWSVCGPQMCSCKVWGILRIFPQFDSMYMETEIVGTLCTIFYL